MTTAAANEFPWRERRSATPVHRQVPDVFSAHGRTAGSIAWWLSSPQITTNDCSLHRSWCQWAPKRYEQFTRFKGPADDRRCSFILICLNRRYPWLSIEPICQLFWSHLCRCDPHPFNDRCFNTGPSSDWRHRTISKAACRSLQREPGDKLWAPSGPSLGRTLPISFLQLFNDVARPASFSSQSYERDLVAIVVSYVHLTIAPRLIGRRHLDRHSFLDYFLIQAVYIVNHHERSGP